MAPILKRVPIPRVDELAFVGAEHVRIKGKEIIVWVSLSPESRSTWKPGTPCFPAIIDTGHTHNFSIQEKHLIRWAGLRMEALELFDHIRQAGKRVPLHSANIWLHPNEPGKRERSETMPPFLMKLPRGIAIYSSSETDFPRLPLLGMGVLLTNKLHLTVDGKNQWANLRTQDWRTRLLSWLS